MKKVLITGASGFIGYHLAKRLSEKNYDVHCLVRTTSHLERLIPLGVNFCYGDMNDSESLKTVLKRPDIVFHLAGRVRAKSRTEFLETNRGGTQNLIDICAKQPNPPVFLYASSLAAMGPSIDAKPKVETDIPAPISGYGKSKLACEKVLVAFSEKIPCVIIRPGIVFGEADRMNLELFRTIEKIGICPIPGWWDRIYSWVHADDLVTQMIQAVESGERLSKNSLTEDAPEIGKGIYFCSTNQGIKFSEIGRSIGKALEKKHIWPVRCPPLAVFAISSYYEILKRMTGKDQPFDWDKAFEAKYHWTCDPKKSETQLGFSPAYSFQERIAHTVRWYLENGWLQKRRSVYQDASTM